jgi:hypothetical protein
MPADTKKSEADAPRIVREQVGLTYRYQVVALGSGSLSSASTQRTPGAKAALPALNIALH